MQRFKFFIAQTQPDGSQALQPINPVLENSLTGFLPGAVMKQGVRAGGELHFEESLSAPGIGDPGGLSAHRILELLLLTHRVLVVRQDLLSKSATLLASYLYEFEISEVSGIDYDAAESKSNTYRTSVLGLIRGAREIDITQPLPGDPVPEDQQKAKAPAAPQAPAQDASTAGGEADVRADE